MYIILYTGPCYNEILRVQIMRIMKKKSLNMCKGISQLLGPKINLKLNVTFQKSPDNSQLMESKIKIHLK